MKRIMSTSLCFVMTVLTISFSSNQIGATGFSQIDDFGGKAPIYQLLALFQVSVQRNDIEMLVDICTPLTDYSETNRNVISEVFGSHISNQNPVGSSGLSGFDLEIDSIEVVDDHATVFGREAWPTSSQEIAGDRLVRMSCTKISGRWQFSTVTELIEIIDSYSSARQRVDRVLPESEVSVRQSQYANIASVVHSNQLLNPVAFLDQPYIPRATLVYSSMYLDNQTLFGCPTAVSSFKHVDSPSLSHDVVAVSDHCWRRIFVSDLHPDHSYFITKGQFGHGQSLEDFAQPCGMEFMSSGFLYVAEDINNRIKLITLNSSSEDKLFLSRLITIPEFNQPKDVDVDWPDEYGERSIVVANAGNNNIIVFDDQEPWSAHNIRIHNGIGSTLGAFDAPTSVSFGRDPITSAKNHLAYFIDSDGTRIVRIGNWNVVPALYIARSDFPEGTKLTSVGVDNKGEVWAVDNALSKIYKFDKDLRPIAKHGFYGYGDAEYSHPYSISFSTGYDQNSAQMLSNLGEVLLSEDWSAATGIRRLVAGVEVFNGTINFQPRLSTGALAVVSGSYYTTGYANIVETLVGPSGGVVQSRERLMWPSGTQNYSFVLPTSLPSGQYQVRIAAASVYTNSNSDQVTLSVTVDQSIVNQRPVANNIWFPDGDSCFLMDEPKLIRAGATDPDGQVVRYQWEVTIEGSGEFLWTSGNQALFVSHLHTAKIPDPSSYIRMTAIDNYGEPSDYHELKFSKITVYNQFDCDCTWMVGDADFSGELSVSDVQYLIAHLFGAGPAPIPVRLAGDANCSGGLSISDPVYLTSHIFGGGPPPQCTCRDY